MPCKKKEAAKAVSDAVREAHFLEILKDLGENPEREGLVETPRRMRTAYEEIFAGYKMSPKEILKTFKEDVCEEMIVLKNCEFFSMCEHHFFPFFGHVSIGYLPNERIAGISKLARLTDCFARRLQIQERMTSQIADAIMTELDAKGVYVLCEATHFCMTSRGVRKMDAGMMTSAIRGVFRDNAELRASFLSMVR